MPAPPIDKTPQMTREEKVKEAFRRSRHYVAPDAVAILDQMLQPAALAILAATVVGWAVSQFFGVGEIVDLILVVAGAVTLGFSVFSGAKELWAFMKDAVNAKVDHDLDVSAQHFGRAVAILGIATIEALLMKGAAKSVLARGKPYVQARIVVEEPPVAGNRLRVTRWPKFEEGGRGTTNEYGEIEISRDQPMSEQRLTLLHELVHRYLSPRTGPLLKLRAEARVAGYDRSAFLRYIEEALAEGYAQLKRNGLLPALRCARYPIDKGYVAVSNLVGEGRAIGAVLLAGTTFYVSIVVGTMPSVE